MTAVRFSGFEGDAAWPGGRPGILVLGLGNLLLGDDGTGVHAARLLRESPPPGNVLIADPGTSVLNAEYLIERATHILAFDAMQTGGPPGSVYSLGPDDVLRPGLKDSLHEITFFSILDRLPGPRPEVAILAVEPQILDFTLDLSPGVQAALPRLQDEARRIIRNWTAQLPRPLPREDGRSRED